MDKTYGFAYSEIDDRNPKPRRRRIGFRGGEEEEEERNKNKEEGTKWKKCDNDFDPLRLGLMCN